MSEYKYQSGDIVEILPEAYYTFAWGRRGGEPGLAKRAGEQIRVQGLDSDGDVEGHGTESGRAVAVSPVCVKPIELQGIRVGDIVRIVTAYHTNDADKAFEVVRFDLDRSFSDEIDNLPHPFAYQVPLESESSGTVTHYAAEVEKVPGFAITGDMVISGTLQTAAGSRIEDSRVIVDAGDLTITAGGTITARNNPNTNVALRPHTWSEVQLGDVVTAEWAGLKNGVQSSAVVTSTVVEGFMGAEWYGLGLAELRQNRTGLYKVLEIERKLTVAQRRNPQRFVIKRPQTTGGRWDDYELYTSGSCYFEGVPDGSGRGTYDLTAVFDDRRGNVQLKDGDQVWGLGDFDPIPHDQLFDRTHLPA